MKKNYLLVLIIVVSACFTACNSAKIDADFIADKNFPVKTLPDPIRLDSLKYFNDQLFADISHTKPFVKLSARQQLAAVVPFLKSEFSAPDSTINKSVVSYFISKPAKKGDLQPIIIWVGGENYNGLKLIVLNKDYKPVSNINLTGGADAPTVAAGNLVTFEKETYYKINSDTITTVRVSYTTVDGRPSPSPVIDSNVYKSVINQDGTITTKQIVKGKNTVPYKTQN